MGCNAVMAPGIINSVSTNTAMWALRRRGTSHSAIRSNRSLMASNAGGRLFNGCIGSAFLAGQER